MIGDRIANYFLKCSIRHQLEIAAENKKISGHLSDLKKVEYVDSSGLGALLFGHRQAQAHSGKMKLIHVNPRVNTLIQIAKLQDILERYEDEAVAIRSF